MADRRHTHGGRSRSHSRDRRHDDRHRHRSRRRRNRSRDRDRDHSPPAGHGSRRSRSRSRRHSHSDRRRRRSTRRRRDRPSSHVRGSSDSSSTSADLPQRSSTPTAADNDFNSRRSANAMAAVPRPVAAQVAAPAQPPPAAAAVVVAAVPAPPAAAAAAVVELGHARPVSHDARAAPAGDGGDAPEINDVMGAINHGPAQLQAAAADGADDDGTPHRHTDIHTISIASPYSHTRVLQRAMRMPCMMQTSPTSPLVLHACVHTPTLVTH